MDSIDNLSLTELVDLEARVAERIKDKKQEEKTRLLNEFRRMAQENGFDLNELLSSKVKGGKRSRLAPQYQHPSDPLLTWSGRGPRPKWLREAMERGQSIESFKIGD